MGLLLPDGVPGDTAESTGIAATVAALIVALIAVVLVFRKV
jgi:hypothetical protein